MSESKPSDDVLGRMLEKEKSLLKSIEECKVFAAGSGTPFWKAVKERANENLLQAEKLLDGYEKLSPDMRTTVLEARRQIKFFSTFPEDKAKELEFYEKELVAHRAKIKEYRGKLS